MNIIKNLALTGLCLLGLTLSASANVGYSQYATGNQQYLTSTTNYAVISEQTDVGGQTGAQPVLTYINATGINASALLQFLTPTNPLCTLQVTNFGVTNIVSYTNGLVPGQFLVFEHKGDPTTYELAVLASINPTPWTTNTNTPGTTNYTWSINTAVATAATYYANDVIWPMGLYRGSIPVGNATISLTGPGIISGERRKPMLILSGTGTATNSATINAANSLYAP
ncbi:MAG TPA: hypothetical protein VK731_09555 [Candidatus Cybelea sp.]|jgi:hypothetical protein|nr:hypothetical protein [Candidatus Cybelea sp.]